MRALLAETQAEARLRRQALRGRLMREALDQWRVRDRRLRASAWSATLALVGWSWLAMRRAERRRDEARGK